MVSARDIYAQKRKDLKNAKPVVKKMVKESVKPVVPEATDDELEEYAAKITDEAAKEIEADLDDYQDQEREFEGMEELTEGGNEARGLLQDFNRGDDKLGLASLTHVESRDQAAAMMELRILHKHYPQFDIDDIPIWLDAYSVSIGRAGRKENTDVLRGNVPIAPPTGPPGPPRW